MEGVAGRLKGRERGRAVRRGEQKSQGTRLSLPKATSLELSLSPPPVFSFFPISPFPPFSFLLHTYPIMPTCRRKRVLLTEPSPALQDALHNDPKKEVFYLAQTGEIFESYECAHFLFILPFNHPTQTSSLRQCICSSHVFLQT